MDTGTIRLRSPALHFTVLETPRVRLQWMRGLSDYALLHCILGYWALKSGSALDAGIIWFSRTVFYSTPRAGQPSEPKNSPKEPFELKLLKQRPNNVLNNVLKQRSGPWEIICEMG